MRQLLLSAFAIAICTLSGSVGYQRAGSDRAGWREIAWPFPRDGWPAGRAFRCGGGGGGGKVGFYVRAQNGFFYFGTRGAEGDEKDPGRGLRFGREKFFPPGGGG